MTGVLEHLVVEYPPGGLRQVALRLSPEPYTRHLGGEAILAVEAVRPEARPVFINGVSGMTKAPLRLENIQPRHAGAYAVVVSNEFSVATSGTASFIDSDTGHGCRFYRAEVIQYSP